MAGTGRISMMGRLRSALTRASLPPARSQLTVLPLAHLVEPTH